MGDDEQAVAFVAFELAGLMSKMEPGTDEVFHGFSRKVKLLNTCYEAETFEMLNDRAVAQHHAGADIRCTLRRCGSKLLHRR